MAMTQTHSPDNTIGSPCRPLRLVHITTVPLSLIFFRGQIGYLKSRGFDVAAISSPGPMLDEAAAREAIPVHAVPIARRLAPLSDLSALIRLWKLLRKQRPDVVHSHTPKAGLLGTIAARLAGVPAVYLSVFGLPQMTRQGPMRWLLDATTRLACRLADRVWCDSRSMADYLVAQRLASPHKVMVIGHGSVNGVDTTDRFAPTRFSLADREALRRHYDIPADAPIVGFVGRVVADKGIRELTAAWSVLRERHPTLYLLVVGPQESGDSITSNDEQRLRSDPRVRLVGMQTDVPPFLSVMDVFVNPSYREGFGIANLEASAMSIPVVATRIPGCVDSVADGVTGTLVPVRDAEALATAIDTYLRDADLRQKHGSAGRERAIRDFNPLSIWQALEAEYRQTLNATSRKSRLATTLDGCAKRLLDIVVSAIALVVLSPLLVVVAITVRVAMGRPVLFRQVRPGLHGQPFGMFKFRTMTQATRPDGSPEPDGQRLTPLGRFLRGTSLDELPELFNILRGDMSLVGPRPLLMQYLPRYSPTQARRHEVRPGLTGWAQIHGRNLVDWDERLQLDVWYVDHRSLWLDLKILLKTVLIVFRREGISAVGQATMTEFMGSHATVSTAPAETTEKATPVTTASAVTNPTDGS
jgi:lipopolysaccharide/colanic/teichoic acid biosynthesis glycosyltransferase/glycosyltransferase involved in cell wall biosynthesis